MTIETPQLMRRQGYKAIGRQEKGHQEVAELFIFMLAVHQKHPLCEGEKSMRRAFRLCSRHGPHTTSMAEANGGHSSRNCRAEG